MNGATCGDNILSSLHDTLEMALKYGDPEDYNIEKYKEMVKVVCKIEHGCLIGGDIVKEAAKLSSIEAFDQALADSLNESQPKFKAQSSKRYLDFMKKAQQMIRIERGDDANVSQSSQMQMDEDISQPNEVISDIDPITKKRLENPVRNKHCRHIYGYQSVLQSLQRNSRLRCPIVGCANKKFVEMSDLIEDEDLVVRLAQQRNSQQ